MMKRWTLAGLFVFLPNGTVLGNTYYFFHIPNFVITIDLVNFVLTPVAPPTPALKYELLTDPIDLKNGNAADFYKFAYTVWPDGIETEINNASVAMGGADSKQFDSLATALYQNHGGIFKLLEIASQQVKSDWTSGFGPKGLATYLAYLRHSHELGRLELIHAEQLIRQGKSQEALDALRIVYMLARNTAQDPRILPSLVGIEIDAMADDRLIELMSRPESPNLYWALATLPRPLFSFRRAVEGERYLQYASIPLLAKARTGELTADEWRKVFSQLDMFNKGAQNGTTRPSLEQEAKAILPLASAYYASTRHLTADQVANIDPLTVSGVYWYEKYQGESDEIWKLSNLSYPQIIAGLHRSYASGEKEKNPFITRISSVVRFVQECAVIDRHIAALTAVEAIRSYAAANGGKLPGSLNDLTETPVQNNPYTDKPFEYQVDGQTAILSDFETVDHPLKYTIQIRK
jgi:hypothetical protein